MCHCPTTVPEGGLRQWEEIVTEIAVIKFWDLIGAQWLLAGWGCSFLGKCGYFRKYLGIKKAVRMRWRHQETPDVSKQKILWSNQHQIFVVLCKKKFIFFILGIFFFFLIYVRGSNLWTFYSCWLFFFKLKLSENNFQVKGWSRLSFIKRLLCLFSSHF